MRTILLTALFAFTLVLTTTTTRAWTPASDFDCAYMDRLVRICY